MIELAKALVALQADLMPVNKSKTNPFFKSKYAPLDEVAKDIQPLLAKHRLAVLQPLDNLEGKPAIRTVIMHDSGEHLESVTPLMLTKNDPQSHGSAITYTRRYGLMSALGLVADEDDDGNRASEPKYPKTGSEMQDALENGGVPKLPPKEREASRQVTYLNGLKKKINDELERQGYAVPVAKQAFLTRVLKKQVVSTAEEAQEVLDALEAEAAVED